ncbi:DNA gyrase inhibitor YacG [Methylobacillus flagellatus]|uniref:DNA gyrase inhibitor YacG n=1 Tax=Methylobacillus flagellatus TaxID=405 RepID=UPI0010F8D9E1|nr:DNA gyrase inhibitor YacG [Methylobacillus flagellatus]
MTSASIKRVACPQCGKDAIFSPENPYRPFCSQRCQQIDLGAWANEDFRIPVAPEPEE